MISPQKNAKNTKRGFSISAFFALFCGHQLPLQLQPRCARLAATTLLFAFCFPSGAQEKVTYQDNVLPIIDNNCAKCHNSDKKKGDLDLTSYNGALKGGGSGMVLVSGNLEGSKLW